LLIDFNRIARQAARGVCMAAGIVGREAERASLEEVLDAVSGGPAAILLEGEAGIGKTALWQEAVASARRRSYRVLTCRPVESETQMSFAGLSDLFDDVGEATLEILPSPQRRALEVALLRAETDESGVDSRAVPLSVLAVLRALAETGPVILAVDDIHWLDPPSARVLEFAIRRLDRERVGVIATRRTGPGGRRTMEPRLPGVDDSIPRLRLGPLGVDEIDRLLSSRERTRFVRPTLLQLHRTSAGNPFYALEIARALLRTQAPAAPGQPLPVPDTLRALLQERLAGIPPDARTVLLVVTAMPVPTVKDVGEAMRRLDRGKEALDEAVGAGVIEIEDERVRPTHHLLGSVLYADTPPAERRHVHTLLADISSDPEEKARHLALAAEEPDESVAAALDEAARIARLRGAPDAAAELTELALGLTPPNRTEDTIRRTIAAGEYHFEAGDTPRGRSFLETAVTSMSAGPARAGALRLLGTIRWYDNSDEATGLFDQALEESGEDVALRAAIHRDRAWAFMMGGAVLDAAEHARSAVEGAEQVGDTQLQSEALTVLGFTEAFQGKGDPLHTIERAVGMEEHTVGLHLFPHPSFMFGVLLKWSDRFDLARDRMLAARQWALDAGEESSLPLMLYHLSELECWAGNWGLAERYAQDALDSAAQTAQLSQRAVALYASALVDARLGRAEAARSHGEDGLALAEKRGAVIRTMQNLSVLGFLDLSLGNAAGAQGSLARVAELATDVGMGEPGILRYRADYIETLVVLGELDQAEEVATRLEDQGKRLDRAWALATAGRCRGLLIASRGGPEDAIPVLEQALRDHERLPDPFERARTELVLGTVYRRNKQKQAAMGALGRALQEFERLGAGLWIDRARAEMARIGGRGSGEQGLTPTEQRVAAMVVAGHTNREIADGLFLSVKTVEANLSRIYHKVGVRSRTELVRKLSTESGPWLADQG
jgi:DNA-binding CsgD family transcriptional regulator